MHPGASQGNGKYVTIASTSTVTEFSVIVEYVSTVCAVYHNTSLTFLYSYFFVLSQEENLSHVKRGDFMASIHKLEVGV